MHELFCRRTAKRFSMCSPTLPVEFASATCAPVVIPCPRRPRGSTAASGPAVRRGVTACCTQGVAGGHGCDSVGRRTATPDHHSADATGTNGVSLVVNGVESNGPGVSASGIQSIRINQNPYTATYAAPGRARLASRLRAAPIGFTARPISCTATRCLTRGNRSAGASRRRSASPSKAR